MSRILVLTLTADAATAQPIVDALIKDRLDVQWIQLDPADPDAVAATRGSLDESRAALFVWSGNGLAPEAAPYLDLAKSAQRQGKAICVKVEAIDLPPSLAGCPTYSLHGWRASPGAIRRFFGGELYLRDVVAAAQFRAAGRDPSPPSAPRKMRMRQLLVAIPALFALLGIARTLIGFWDMSGLSDRPSREEQAAWTALDGSCEGLRGFLAAHPDGRHAAKAQARLDGRRVTLTRTWQAAERSLPVYVSLVDARTAATEARAQAGSHARAVEAANAACRRLAEAGSARLRGAVLGDGEYSCGPVDGGMLCAFDGSATCRLDEPRDIQVEECRSE